MVKKKKKICLPSRKPGFDPWVIFSMTEHAHTIELKKSRVMSPFQIS